MTDPAPTAPEITDAMIEAAAKAAMRAWWPYVVPDSPGEEASWEMYEHSWRSVAKAALTAAQQVKG